MLRHGHLFFYLADESGHVLNLAGDTLDIDKNSLLASGSRSDIGDWQLHLESKVIWKWIDSYHLSPCFVNYVSPIFVFPCHEHLQLLIV